MSASALDARRCLSPHLAEPDNQYCGICFDTRESRRAHTTSCRPFRSSKARGHFLKSNDMTVAFVPTSQSSPIRARNSRNCPNSPPPMSAQRLSPLNSSTHGEPLHLSRKTSPGWNIPIKCRRKAPSSRHAVVAVGGPPVRNESAPGGIEEYGTKWSGRLRACNPLY
jgi:hypothetical protein